MRPVEMLPQVVLVLSRSCDVMTPELGTYPAPAGAAGPPTPDAARLRCGRSSGGTHTGYSPGLER